VAGCALTAGVLASGGTRSGGAIRAVATPHPKPRLELPRGGRTLFPRYRVVAYYGAPGDTDLGALGIGTPAQAGKRLVAQTRGYRRGGRRLLPAMELIAVVAAGSAQNDGSYTRVHTGDTVRQYLAAARRLRALLILDIQPGHGDFVELAHRFGRFLREPDVGLALDPEWHTPGAVPGTVIGSTDARTVNRISAYLARIVARYRLPQKLLVVHEFTESMISGKPQLRRRAGVAMVLNVDGFGDPPNKIAKYREFTHEERRFHDGIKLFYKEDTDLMPPARVLHLRPRPEFVVYE